MDFDLSLGSKVHGGRDIFSHNNTGTVTSSTTNYTTTNVVCAGATEAHEVTHDIMARFFLSHSRNHEIDQDDAIGRRTPGTGQWFLRSNTYRSWKAGKVPHLACTGIPGAGKTVMSSIVIQDLVNTSSDAAILWMFNKSTTESLQEPRLLVLSFLGQILQSSAFQALSPEFVKFYRTYRNETCPPNHQRAKQVLRIELKRFQRAFIVIDALDEFRVGDPNKQKTLVKELETLGASILITSRSPIPFTPRTFFSCEIRASRNDIRTFVTATIREGPGILDQILAQREGLTERVVDSVTAQADGLFLKAKLTMQAMETCQTIAPIKQLLESIPGNLQGIYGSIIEDIRTKTPWASRLLILLTIMDDAEIEARAVLQYLACEDWHDGRIEDHTRTVREVLVGVRGLVNLSVASSDGDLVDAARSADTLSPGTVFQFAHKTTQDYLLSILTEQQSLHARLDFLHTLLRYTIRVLDAIPEDLLELHADQGHAYLHEHYPLVVHHNLWLSYAAYVESQIDQDLVNNCFTHRCFAWLAECVLEGPAPGTVYLTISLARHNLAILLQQHLQRNTDFSLDERNARDETALQVACISGSCASASILLLDGASVDFADAHGWTPLALACHNYHEDVVSVLLDNGASITATNEDGMTPLLLACDSDSETIVSLLLSKGAHPDTANRNGMTPLAIASSNGNTNIVSVLLYHKATTDLADQQNGWTPLIYASRHGRTAAASALLSHGADINFADNDGWTPLIHAVASAHIKHGVAPKAGNQEGLGPIVLALLEMGANIDKADLKGSTPLMLSAQYGDVHVVSILVKKGAAVDATNIYGRTALMFACLYGRANVVSQLLAYNAKQDAVDLEGQTALVFAAYHNHDVVASLLLWKSASADSTRRTGVAPLADISDRNGWTPLTYAARYGYGDVVDQLLKHNATVDKATNLRTTPLSVASRYGHTNIVSKLLAPHLKADINAVDQEGRSPLLFAARYGHIDVASLLLQRGAEVDLAGSEGWTPLMYAALNGVDDLVRLLLDKGANAAQRSKEDRTALDYAQTNGNAKLTDATLQRLTLSDHERYPSGG